MNNTDVGNPKPLTLHRLMWRRLGRHTGRLGPAILFLLFSFGCMVGPDFHRPTPWVPANYLNATQAHPSTKPSATIATADTIEIVQWWRTLHDAELDQLVQRAAGQNLDLKQAAARLHQARAALGVANAPLLPQIGAEGQYTHSGTGLKNSRGSDLYLAGPDAAWELDIFGQTRRNIESAQANVQAAEWDRRNVLLTVVAEVATDYINLRSFQRRIAIAQRNLEFDRKAAQLTRARFNAGFVARLDVANAEAQAATTESEIPPLVTLAQETIYSLGILLGREPASLADELSAEHPIPISPSVIPVGLPAELLRRRPDIRLAEANLHAATAQVGVAVAELYPQVSLNGTLSLEANKIKPLGNWASSVWSFGPTITWPIFEGGSLLANIDQQNALEEQAVLTYRQTVLTALQEVENALVSLSQEQARRDALAQAVVSNRQALDLSSRLYRQGQTDFLNVLNAERSLLSVEDALAQSEAAVAIDSVTLYKALGGGWEIDPRVREALAPATRPATTMPTLSRQLLYPREQ